MDKEVQEILGWLIGFANMDLANLRPEEKIKATDEAEKYLFPKTEIDQLKRDYPLIDYLIGVRGDEVGLSSQIGNWVCETKWMFNIPPSDSSKYWDIVLKTQESLKRALDYVYHLAENGHSRRLEITEDLKNENFLYYFKAENESLNFCLLPQASGPQEYIRFKVLKLFDKVPMKALRKCKECKKWFIDFTKRKKYFCFKTCTWKLHGRRYRQKPEYIKAHRESVRKAYRRAKAKERKVPYDKVKIQKRRDRKEE